MVKNEPVTCLADMQPILAVPYLDTADSRALMQSHAVACTSAPAATSPPAASGPAWSTTSAFTMWPWA